MIVCWAMGLTQHKNAVANVQRDRELPPPRAATSAGRGRGRARCAATATCRATARWASGSAPSRRSSTRSAREFGFEPPRKPGFDVVETIHAMHDGERPKVFFAIGGNFLRRPRHRRHRARRSRAAALTVHVSTKLNRAHLVTGAQAPDPALPRPHRGRRAAPARPQFVTVEDSMGIVHAVARARCARRRASSAASRDRRPPRRRELSARRAASTGTRSRDYDRIRDAHRARRPGLRGLQRAGPRRPAASTCRTPPRDARFSARRRGKAQFTVHPLPAHDLPPGQLLLMTMRSHDQYNTTVYGLDDRYRGRPRRAARRLHERRRHARLGLAGDSWSTSRATSRTASAPPSASRSCPTPFRAAAARRTSPRRTCSSRWRRRREEQHADVEVRAGRLQPAG